MVAVRRLVAVGVVLGALGFAPQALAAGMVQYGGGTPNSSVYYAGDADDDVVTISGSPAQVVVSSTTPLTNTDPNCTGGGTNTVTCAVAPGDGPFSYVDASLGDGNDQLRVNGSLDGSYSGDAGTDAIAGGDGQEHIDGGDGNDTINGGGGDDHVDGDNGVDSVDGGAGYDSTEVPPANTPPEGLVVDLAAGRFTNAAGTETLRSVEEIDTGEGPDSVTGSAAAERFSTFGGNDTVNPGAGADTVLAGAGDDTVLARDGYPDLISCGPGNDNAVVDQLDTVAGCESVQAAAVRPADADLVAPVCSLTRAPRAAQRRKTFARGLKVTVTCNEAASLTARLIVRFKSVKRNKVVTARAGDIVLAERSLALAGGPRSFTLKPSKGLLKRLGSRFKTTLVVEARDQFGNRSTLSKRLSVKTPKKKSKRRRR